MIVSANKCAWVVVVASAFGCSHEDPRRSESQHILAAVAGVCSGHPDLVLSLPTSRRELRETIQIELERINAEPTKIKRAAALSDAWGRELRFEVKARSVRIVSSGANGILHDDDDLEELVTFAE